MSLTHKSMLHFVWIGDQPVDAQSIPSHFVNHRLVRD